MLGLSPVVEQPARLAMEPVGRPVRRDVGAVAPDGADLLSSHRLPDVLTVLDVLACEEDLAIARDNALRDGRGLAVHLPPKVAEHREGRSDHRTQADPEPRIPDGRWGLTGMKVIRGCSRLVVHTVHLSLTPN